MNTRTGVLFYFTHCVKEKTLECPHLGTVSNTSGETQECNVLTLLPSWFYPDMHVQSLQIGSDRAAGQMSDYICQCDVSVEVPSGQSVEWFANIPAKCIYHRKCLLTVAFSGGLAQSCGCV